MHQSEGETRERGGSFAAPNERASSNATSNENDIQTSTITSSAENETLDDVKSRNRIQLQAQRAPDQSYRSPPSRPRQGSASKPIVPMDISTTQHTKSHTSSPRGVHPEPPVTKATLAELDVPRIVLNPKLRHDVNFDPDLHFRPNLDGEKGKKKLKKANEFWSVLKVQMQSFMQDPVAFQLEHAGKEWCLPATLRAIGDILETLVPPEDRAAVAAIMNVDMLMQQLGKGIADLESLAEWLAKTLKQHCAPMRDEWVSEMVVQLSKGNRERDVNQLAGGLQTLMGVLEAMKLDVANHQIRCLRPLLVQDTVDFEQSFFMKKIASRKVDVTHAHAWFRAAQLPSAFPTCTNGQLLPNLETFVKAFTICLLPSHATEKVPETFQFDEERVIKLRADVLDAVNTEVCIRLFRKVFAESQLLADQCHTQQQQQDHMHSNYASSVRSDTPMSDEDPSRSTIPDFHTRVHTSSIARERGHFRRSDFPDTLVWEPQGSPVSSLYPVSSNSSRSSTPASFQDHSQSSIASQRSRIFLQSQPTETQEATFIGQLHAILEDTALPTTAMNVSANHLRWTTAAPSLALAILHATSHPLTSYTAILPYLEAVVASALNTHSSLLFAEAEESVLAGLLPIATHLIQSLALLDNTRVFEISVLPKGKQTAERLLKDGLALCTEDQKKVARRDDISDIARGLGHVAVLHWKVWGPLCYVIDPDAPKRCSTPEIEMGGMEEHMSARSSTSSFAPRDRDLEKRRRDRERETRRGYLKRRSPDRSPAP